MPISRDPIAVLATRFVDICEKETTRPTVAAGALALALSVLLREMHHDRPAPTDVMAFANECAKFAADAAVAYSRYLAELQ